MYLLPIVVRRFVPLAALLFRVVSLNAETSNLTFRVMSANLNGNTQSYQPFALRIFQGLKPDVVAIQEFNYNSTNGLGNNTAAAFREMLDTAFGTNFVYVRETGSYAIPNGVISRYPIVASGQWTDSLVSDRGFAWAQIHLPGTNDLYLVSVHLYSSGTATDRNTEATEIKTQIRNNFPPNAWVIVAGDFNTQSRSEAAISTFSTFLSDAPIPTDAESGGNPNTNDPRNKPYDYVLPSFSMTNRLTNVVFVSHSFANGLVFDSRIYTPLTDVSPIQIDDSSNAQHMAVLKDFVIDTGTSNSAAAPSITVQPQSQIVPPGSNATFTVSAIGDPPMSYQWRFNGADIGGATASTYVRANVQVADAGYYSVVVTNVAGSITSSNALLSVNSSLPSGIIAQWNFNATNAATLNSPPPSIGAGALTLIGGTSAAWVSGSGSVDTNAPNNAWNTTSYPAQGTLNKTAGAQFAVSTAGRQNVSIRWDQRASNTGSKYARLQYTTNGTTFLNFPTPAVLSSAGTFEPQTNNLAGIPGVNNNPNFAFRLVAEFESTALNDANANYVGASGTYGSGGTLRFDMVTVSGTPLGSPASAVLGAPNFSGNQFQFTVTGTVGSNYIIQATTNLSSPIWLSLLTNASPFTFTNSASAPARFYRAVAQ